MTAPTPGARLRRRDLLKRLGITATLAYSAPVLLQLSAARASSFSGPSGVSDRSDWSAPSHPQRVRQTRPQQRARPAPPPELLVTVQSEDHFAALEDGGFRLLSAQSIMLIDQWIGRFALPQGMSLDEARARAAELVPTGRVDDNDIYRTSELLCSNDECEAFSMIGWPQSEPCDAAPVIGLVDTGINPDHDAFAGQALELLDFDRNERDPAGLIHGTAIAALLIGRPQSRTPGLLPNARLVAVDAFYADPQGDAADAFSLVRALDQLAGHQVDVINMSFAGPDNFVLSRAIAALAERGVALVAAAGNDGPRAAPRFPAAYDPVLAVTAVDKRHQVYRQAVAGEHIGFAAPGVNLWTAASTSGGRLRSGTSYAAPFVTAALAVARDRDPEAPVRDIVEQLARNAEDLGPEGFDTTYGWGLVRADMLCIVPA